MAFVIEQIRKKGLAVVVGFALGFMANAVLSHGRHGATSKDECFEEAAKNPTEKGVNFAAALCTQKFGEWATP